MKHVQRFSDEQLAYGRKLAPDQVLRFLEDFRLLHGARAATGGRSTAISLRVGDELLRAFKAKAAAHGVRYQAQIKRLMEDWVKGGAGS